METQTQPAELVELEVCAREGALLVPDDAEKLEIVNTLKPIVGRMEGYKAFVQSLKITSHEDADTVGVMLEKMDEDLKAVETVTESWCSRAFKYHRKVTGMKGLIFNPLTALRKSAKDQKNRWEDRVEAENKRREAEVQAELDRQDEAKRQTILKEAQRKEQEALNAKRTETADRKRQEAEELKEQAASIVTPVIHHEAAPKTAGPPAQKRWCAAVEDLGAFLEAAVKDPNLRGYITVSTSAMQGNKSRNTAMTIPGVKFWQERK